MMSLEFENKVFQQLDSMQPGERIELNPDHRNYQRFIDAVKLYIDLHRYGNGIEFSHDYRKVKKQHWPLYE